MLLNGEGHAWPAHSKELEVIQVINSQLDFIWDEIKPAAEVAADMTSEIDTILQS